MLFAVLVIPAEIFMWIRLSHFVRSWFRFLSRKKVDNWAKQAQAERGSGSSHWVPLIMLVIVIAALIVIWVLLGPVMQSTILWIGWPVVGVVTVVQTVMMLFKLMRRQQGYKV